MLEEKKTFELEPVVDDSTGKYVIKDYNKQKEVVTKFVEEAVNAVIVINDDIAYKSVKSTRTDIRKKKDAITQARLHINALLLGDFNAQLKEIETLLDNADKDLKAKMTTYDTEVKGKLDNRPHVITLTVKGYDATLIEKVRKYASELGLGVEVK